MIRRQRVMIFHDDEGVWEIQREHSFNNKHNVAHSQLLVCPKCLKPWAALLLEGEVCGWPAAQFCSQCRLYEAFQPVPGSLLTEEGWGIVDDSLLAALPPELVRREFNLHLEAYSHESIQHVHGNRRGA